MNWRPRLYWLGMIRTRTIESAGRNSLMKLIELISNRLLMNTKIKSNKKPTKWYKKMKIMINLTVMTTTEYMVKCKTMTTMTMMITTI